MLRPLLPISSRCAPLAPYPPPPYPGNFFGCLNLVKEQRV